MQAADRLWGERGVRGASLDDIAREASVTKPTVYYSSSTALVSAPRHGAEAVHASG